MVVLISVEHDERWIAVMEQYLQQLSVSPSVYFVVHAPLAPVAPALKDEMDAQKWYDYSALEEQLGKRSFDMVLVDGPPAYQTDKQEARYPALPFMKERLECDFVVLLDDVGRDGERSIVERWIDRYDLNLSVNVGDSGLGVLRPVGTDSTYQIA